MFALPSVGNSSQGCDGDRRARFLLAQLQAVERGVASALAQQLVVTPCFDDRPILDDEDAIGIDDGMQAMRWRSPPATCKPCSPTCMSYPRGNAVMKSCA